MPHCSASGTHVGPGHTGRAARQAPTGSAAPGRRTLGTGGALCDLVDGLLVAIEELGEVGVPGAPFDGGQDATGNGTGIAAGDADDADASAAQGSRDGDNGVVKNQRR